MKSKGELAGSAEGRGRGRAERRAVNEQLIYHEGGRSREGKEERKQREAAQGDGLREGKKEGRGLTDQLAAAFASHCGEGKRENRPSWMIAR